MSKKISTLSPGNLVMLNENGVAKKYIFLEANHYKKNEVVLLRKDTLAPRQWTGSYGSSYNNAYNGSDMDMFCNTQHIQTLDPAIRACLINVPIPTMRGAIYESKTDTTIVNLNRKCFLLSAIEVASGNSGEGTTFSYLNASATNRIAYSDGTSTAVYWWLRSPSAGGAAIAWVVGSGGALSSGVSVYGANCVCPRPALALSSEILVSNSASTDGAYTIEDAAIAGELYQKINNVWRRVV